MADLLATAVTFNRSWTEGGVQGSGKDVLCHDVTLVLTGQGSTTNKIAASVLRLSVIEQTTGFRRSDTRCILAAPSYNGSALVLYDVEVVADADRADPIDVTDTIRGVVKGY